MDFLGIAIGLALLALAAFTLDAVHGVWQRNRAPGPWQPGLTPRYASSPQAIDAQSLAPTRELIGQLRQAPAAARAATAPEQHADPVRELALAE